MVSAAKGAMTSSSKLRRFIDARQIHWNYNSIRSAAQENADSSRQETTDGQRAAVIDTFFFPRLGYYF
jgi:hypothetical protein